MTNVVDPMATTPPKHHNLANEALAEARAEFVERNPKSLAAHQYAAKYLPGGNTRTSIFASPFPLAIQRAWDARVVDLDGHEYLDALGEYTAGLLGHSNETVMEAVRGALDDGISFGGTNAYEARFAEIIVNRYPSIERVRFTNSGTEANLMAIVAARRATGKSTVLVFDGAYHGGVLNFPFGQPADENVPFHFVRAPYNDMDSTRALLEEHRDTLAAVILEPMLGAGGGIVAETSFLQMLRDFTQSAGAALIFDEIQTSRLAPNGIQGEVNVIPDITTIGKYHAGGMSFGAFGGKASIMEAFNPNNAAHLSHAGTFNNNTLTMRAGIAAMSKVVTEEAIHALNAKGNRLRARLTDAIRKHDVDAAVTGRGSIMTVHFGSKTVATAADAAHGDSTMRELFYLHMLQQGVWIARRGMMAMSIPVSEPDLDVIVSAADGFFAEWGKASAQPARA